MTLTIAIFCVASGQLGSDHHDPQLTDAAAFLRPFPMQLRHRPVWSRA